ncbi:hypothetical protein [Streptacidiphilus monticola]|uniref:Uncharacterized protein n=1 Tax=Streptacidiphilus monticola TaxID=2161674 RepID=A0ABW1GC21_9ACTN
MGDAAGYESHFGSMLPNLREGSRVAERLRCALEAHGIKLPSLIGGYPVNATAMVDLGGCRADVAESLAVLLEAVPVE